MVELFILGVTASVAAWLAGAPAHRRRVAARALDRYAQSRGLSFVPPPMHPRGASPEVRGEKDGVVFVVDLYRMGDDVRTRVRADVSHGRAPLLSVAQRGAFAWKKPETLRIGDDAFDAAYVVTTGAAEDADGLRSTRRPLLVLDRCEGVWLSSDGRRVALSWRGMESDPIVLDAARDAVVVVAGWHRPESPYR
jgi:hypothetical protein